MSIHRRHPRVALEGEPGYQLVGPPGNDGLSCPVTRRMVEVASPGARFSVAARPGRDVHRVHRGFSFTGTVRNQQLPERFGVDPAFGERGVEAAPTSTVDRRKAQVDRGWDTPCAQDRVRQLEEGVRPTTEAPVKLCAERPNSVVGGSPGSAPPAHSVS
jgi:hypothetical protein